MKLYKLLPVLMLLFLAACNNAPERPEPLLDQTQTANPGVNVTPVTTMPTPAGTASALPLVNHYICANNCAGSGGPSAGNCPVCGTAYTHNAEFHNQVQNNVTPGTPGSTPPLTATPSGTPGGTPPASTPEPAQNATGVWHYTCSSGCAGGAGSAVACASCGQILVHNTQYHQ